MSAFDKYPLGKPAFVTHSLDRAAHLRTNDEKLFAMEGQSNARAYVVYRDSLVMKQEENGPRALLSIKEALDYGANPGTIFLGLREGAPVFGMGISPAAAEKLVGRNDVAVTELRGMAMQGHLPLEQLSSIAMAKSLVGWHQRHGFCANCGARTSMKEGGWKRDCPACKAEHFPRTDPVVIMFVNSGERALLGRQKQFMPGMYSCLAGFVEAAETIEDAVAREIFEESGKVLAVFQGHSHQNDLKDIRGIPGVVDARIQQSNKAPVFRVDMDRSLAQGLGLTARDHRPAAPAQRVKCRGIGEGPVSVR